MDPTEFIGLLSTPRLTRLLQTCLLSAHPHLQVDGLFGAQTGKAMGEAYAAGELPEEWRSQIPEYKEMYSLQVIASCHFPITIDGHFGPQTGEALGNVIQNGLHIPQQRTNDDAIALLKHFEGNGLPGRPFQAYICPTGKPTIGWGHTKTVTHDDVANGRTITEEQAERSLREDLAGFEDAVRSHLKVSVGSNMFSALVLLTYNVGSWNLRNSTALRETNRRNYHEAAAAIELFNKGDIDGDGDLEVIEGLRRRRKTERELYERDL